MFWSVLLVILAVLHAYVVWRASGVPAVTRRVSRRVLAGVGMALWATLVASWLLAHDASSSAARALESFGMTWMAVLFLLASCLLAVDAFTLFGLVWRRRAPALRGWAMVGAGVLSLVALVQGVRAPVVREHEVSLAGLPGAADGAVLVAISDLHLGNTLGARWLAARVEQVRSLDPDLVVLLGDVFEGHGDPDPELIAVLGRLAAPHGVWAVTGNHEFHGGRGASLGAFEQAGVTVLHDGWAEASPGLVLAGVDDLARRQHGGVATRAIERALAGRPAGATVFLSHTPTRFETVAEAGVGLMLAGHTHGGQLWPFGYLVALESPLLGGRYEVGGMPVIVCRGTGTWGPRMRLWRPSEILRITLRTAPVGRVVR